jgi:hypothetical protein
VWGKMAIKTFLGESVKHAEAIMNPRIHHTSHLTPPRSFALTNYIFENDFQLVRVGANLSGRGKEGREMIFISTRKASERK